MRDGQAVPLTEKAFNALAMLIENSGHLLEREEMLTAIWHDSFVEEANLTVTISAVRKALGEQAGGQSYIETVPKRGYRFVAEVSLLDEGRELLTQRQRGPADDERSTGRPVMLSSQTTLPAWHLDPVGGAIRLDSIFYIARPADHEFHCAVSRGDSIVLIKGPRQVGKTSLLARTLQLARDSGAKVVVTDFQAFTSRDLESTDNLLLAMANYIAEQLDLDVLPAQVWVAERGPGINLERYLRREVLGRISSPIVWGLDEIDRLFSYSFASEVFGLFRSWHNKRALSRLAPGAISRWQLHTPRKPICLSRT